MFKKRIKKAFPAGTFIPTPARLMAILQLCISFSLLLWILSKPFMGDLFTAKSHLLLYESIMDIDVTSSSERSKDRESLFLSLPSEMQKSIIAGYAAVKSEMQSSFWLRFYRSLELLALKTPPLKLAWIFFSILIPILILKRREGAAPAIWLLLIITLAYAIDNRLNAPRNDFNTYLYPTEELLLERYIKQPLKTSIFEQAEQLKEGWQLYLVDEWAKERISENPQKRAAQIEKGQLAFNIARLSSMGSISSALSINAPHNQLPLWVLGLYLFWNCLLCVTVEKYCRSLK